MDQDGFIDTPKPPSLSECKKLFEQLSANYGSGKVTHEQFGRALQELWSHVKTLGPEGEQLANQISDKSMSIPHKKETLAEMLQRLIKDREAQSEPITSIEAVATPKPSDFTPDPKDKDLI